MRKLGGIIHGNLCKLWNGVYAIFQNNINKCFYLIFFEKIKLLTKTKPIKNIFVIFKAEIKLNIKYNKLLEEKINKN